MCSFENEIHIYFHSSLNTVHVLILFSLLHFNSNNTTACFEVLFMICKGHKAKDMSCAAVISNIKKVILAITLKEQNRTIFCYHNASCTILISVIMCYLFRLQIKTFKFYFLDLFTPK